MTEAALSQQRLGRATLLDASQAIAGIGDGEVITISGGGYRVVPESLLEALERRFVETGSPHGLTCIAISMLERSRAGRGGRGTGLNRLARDGLMAELICSSFARSNEQELNRAIHDGVVKAHNLPMGTIVQWLRAIGAGHEALFTEVGLESYIDPRAEGGRMNKVTTKSIGDVIAIEGREYIRYPTRPVGTALIKATSADRRGNLYLDREAFSHGVLYTAMAARNSGGRVVAQVDQIVEDGMIHPRMGRIPGSMVDVVVVSEDEFEDEHLPVLTGECREQIPRTQPPPNVRTMIARRILAEIPSYSAVNLGAGIPMYEVPIAAHAAGRDDIYFSIEQGPTGGLPGVGGVARNPDMILDQLEMFDYYEGGGPDVSVLSFGEIDRFGNVNVSRFGDKTPGCGGFPNIAHRIPKLVFSGTFTTGGLETQLENGRLSIIREGSIRRFVPDVTQTTFSARRALRQGQRLTVVTERCILQVTPKGLVATEIAPGIDFERDIQQHAGFEIALDPCVRTMDPAFFTEASPRPRAGKGLFRNQR